MYKEHASLVDDLLSDQHLLQNMDAYADYLAALDIATAVLANSDIKDLQGNVLFPKFTRITSEVVAALKGRDLAQPFALSVSIAIELSAKDLYNDFSIAIHADPFFFALQERYKLNELLEKGCASFIQFSLLRQIITVMARLMPDLYRRSLHTTLLALLLAQEMRLTPVQTQEIFLAALSHDLGMLHINPRVLFKTEPLTADDWTHIQQHVLLGKHFLSLIPAIPATVMDAVAEHHERCDGTGYPTGKLESELSLPGQIVALADSVVAIYFNHFKDQGRSWRDVIPVIEMNAHAYLYRSNELLTIILRRSELPVLNVVHDNYVPEFAAQLLQQNIYLHNWFLMLRECLLAVGFTHGDRKLHALQNIVLHIATSLKGSVLFQEEFKACLETMKTDPSATLEQSVEEASVLQHEMLFHLQRLTRMMHSYLTSGDCKNPAIAATLQAAFTDIMRYVPAEQH